MAGRTSWHKKICLGKFYLTLASTEIYMLEDDDDNDRSSHLCSQFVQLKTTFLYLFKAILDADFFLIVIVAKQMYDRVHLSSYQKQCVQDYLIQCVSPFCERIECDLREICLVSLADQLTTFWLHLIILHWCSPTKIFCICSTYITRFLTDFNFNINTLIWLSLQFSCQAKCFILSFVYQAKKLAPVHHFEIYS